MCAGINASDKQWRASSGRSNRIRNSGINLNAHWIEVMLALRSRCLKLKFGIFLRMASPKLRFGSSHFSGQ